MTKNKIENAKKLLLSGELVIFPTETVYGLGGNANDRNAVKKIYKIKNRPTNNPIICHFSNIKDIKIYVDPKASLFLIGTQMDYQEGELESGFKFINPNEKGRCGCGESFHV